MTPYRFTVGCWGVVKLGAPSPWVVQGGPAQVGASMFIQFTESSRLVKTWLILLS